MIKKWKTEVLILSLFCSACVWLCFIPFYKVNFTSFDRQIGIGLLRNIDAGLRISKVYFYFLIFIPAVFLIIHTALSVYYKFVSGKSEDCGEVFSFLNKLSCVAAVPLLIAFIGRNYGEFNNKYTLICVASGIFILLLYLLISPFLSIRFTHIKSIFLLFASLIYLFETLLIGFNLPYNVRFAFYPTLYAVLLASANFLIKFNILNGVRFERIMRAMIPFAFSGVIISLFFEFVNILNQYGILIKNKNVYVYLIYAVIAVTASAVFIITSARGKTGGGIPYKRYYLGIVLSAVFFLYQIPLQSIIDTALYESANHGLALSEFFGYGKLPIIETFDAHMLKNSFFSFFYGIFNSDPEGAVFIPYLNYIMPFIYFFLFKLLNILFDEDYAFLILILFPVTVPLFFYNFDVIALVALTYALKRNDFKAYLVYFASLALLCLYTLDAGFAMSIGTLAAFFTISLILKLKIKLKAFAAAFASVIIAAGAVFAGLCTAKGINPLIRLRQFLSSAASTNSWAYDSLGDQYSLEYFVFYFVIPLSMIILAGVFLYRLITGQVKCEPHVAGIITALNAAYFANLQRGLTRHTLQEKQIWWLVYTAVLFAVLFFIYAPKSGKRRLEIFPLSFIFIVIILCNINKADAQSFTNSMTDALAVKNVYELTLNETAEYKVKRVVLSKAMEERYNPAIEFLNYVMLPDETYIDFTNQSLLYALSGKEKPVYVNQPPSLLSGEYSQLRFIAECEDYKLSAKYLLLPAKNQYLNSYLDMISNNYRYFLCAEYFYRNFQPLIMFENNVLWCRKEYYDEVYRRVSLDLDEKYELIGYDYGESALHEYNLEQLAYVWGNFDKKNSAENTEIKTLASGIHLSSGEDYIYPIDGIRRDDPVYLLFNVESDASSYITVEFGVREKDGGDFETKTSFKFYVGGDINLNYIIRPGIDYYWYTEYVTDVRVTTMYALDGVTIKFLEGD